MRRLGILIAVCAAATLAGAAASACAFERAPVASLRPPQASLPQAQASLAQGRASSPPLQASLPPPRASLPAIEREVMCVTCKIPLNVAQSQQADRERAFIQGLIDRGESEGQIKRALVGQYGPTVLGLPGAHGFDLSAYLVPLAVVLALLVMLILLLPRWRRRARAQALREAPAATLSATDAARLEADLARFD